MPARYTTAPCRLGHTRADRRVSPREGQSAFSRRPRAVLVGRAAVARGQRRVLGLVATPNRSQHGVALLGGDDCAVLPDHPTAHWLEQLTDAGVPCAPVNDVAAALEDPQVSTRGGVVEYEHPRLGRGWV
jgi:crotonobetainyl-CoA:carnitine CoA-transferase CaiB-like acyl-CoA transferase